VRASIEQLRRVERFLKRVENQNRASDEYDDDFWAFFQNCWHLKDWVKHDPESSAQVQRAVEADVGKLESLRICADMANRTKHFVLTRNLREDARAVHRNVTIRVQGDLSTVSSCAWSLKLADGTRKDALTVAREAVQGWYRLFEHYDIDPHAA
jgi:hypothetical protein